MVIVEIVYFYAHINQDQASPDNYINRSKNYFKPSFILVA